MTTIHTFRHAVQHHAHYAGVPGIAILRAGGYLFQPDHCRDSFLVSYRDGDLVLLGRIDTTPPADERPLWAQIADPGYYEGRDHRGSLVRGK